MATHDYVIANASGASVRQDINNALQAIVSNNSNATSPGVTYAYQFWVDTTANQLKIRNSSNDAWITLRELDGTILMQDGTAAEPSLCFRTDTDTGFYKDGDGRIGITTGGVERATILDAGVIFNDAGNDCNFRVESSGNANMLFVDGGEDAVGIGTSTPGSYGGAVSLATASSGNNTVTIAAGTSSNSSIHFADGTSGDDAYRGIIKYEHSTNAMAFSADASERMRLDSSSRLLLNTASAIDSDTSIKFHSVSNSGAGIALGRSDSSVTSGDDLGRIIFYGNDGGTYQICGQIKCEADGTHADSDKPSRLSFGTTADGAGSPTERMVIDNSGNIGIGASSPANQLELANGDTTIRLNATAGGNAFLKFLSNTGNNNYINFGDTDDDDIGSIVYVHSDNSMRFTTNAIERMRMTSTGHILIDKTAQDAAAAGAQFRGDYPGLLQLTVSNIQVLGVNRLNSDGDVIVIRQDTTPEGSISVSGTTVSYNGGHLSRWSQLAGGAERTEILRGSVLSNLDEMCEWAYEAQDAVLYTEEDELPEGVSVGDVKTPARDAGTEDNEQLNRMKVSDVEGDPNVSGVFQAWDDDDDTYTNDFYCAVTGDFVIRIAQGTTVARGDLLMSAGDGTAKPQDDDIVRSKTIAKVISTTVSTTYSDGSYCVPCVLMAC
jgi:hypothetical protein